MKRERRKERGRRERGRLERDTAGSESVALAVREDSNHGQPVNTWNIAILLTDLPLTPASDLTDECMYAPCSAAQTMRFLCSGETGVGFVSPPLETDFQDLSLKLGSAEERKLQSL